jgi:hypothetical protein
MTPNRLPTPPTGSRLAALPAESSGRLPHIPIPTSRRGGYEVLLWLLVLAVALATSFAVYLFILK